MKPYVPLARNVWAKLSPLSVNVREDRAALVEQRRQTRKRGREDEEQDGAARAHGTRRALAEYNSRLVATKPLVGATSSDDDAPPSRPALPNDIRQTRLLPSSSQLRRLARRLASMVALVAIDIGGLAGALYLALVVRELYYGDAPDPLGPRVDRRGEVAAVPRRS